MHKSLLITAFLFLYLLASGQKDLSRPIYLKGGIVKATSNITDSFIENYNRQVTTVNGKSFAVVQVAQIPNDLERKTLMANGIELLEYIPQHAYLVSFTMPLELRKLRSSGIKSIVMISPEQKLAESLKAIPRESKSLRVLVSVYPVVPIEAASDLLQKAGFTVSTAALEDYPVLEVQTDAGNLSKLASVAFVKYIDTLQPVATPLLFEEINSTRANLLHSSNTGGYSLTGKDVTIGVLEINGAPYPHLDFRNRIANPSSQTDYHATHVTGIVGGAGIINELHKGYAPGSTLISNGPSPNSTTIKNYIQNAGMVLTNNSWASGSVCATDIYHLNNYMMDVQYMNFPQLLHVFAGGNSGDRQCSLYPQGFHTIFGGYQSQKNTLTVGGTLADGQLHPSSSKGPTTDGRIKPEIVAVGSNVVSTIPDNAYWPSNGTSMAAPAVTGGVALLYERFRQLHNQNPPGVLMKAIVSNTATDKGNPGPDYGYGFGLMNLLRAIKVIDSTHFMKGSAAQATEQTHTITIPAGVAKLKVMLYWLDPPPSSFASKALVNDLDVSVTAPDGRHVLPYVLDPFPSAVAQAATRGEDHMNNIEQVVIDGPAAGTYRVKVRGTEIGQTVIQEYFLVYDVVYDEPTLTFPIGGEKLVPGETVSIQWDNWGSNESSFSLHFSTNNGNTWQLINSSVSSTDRQYAWQLPNTVTGNALVKITRNHDGKFSASQPFGILGVPTLYFTPAQCPGFISLQWTAVPEAGAYEVLLLRREEMVPVALTTDTTYTFQRVAEDSVYWVSVRAVKDGTRGRRAIAISRTPDTGNCAGDFVGGDLKADAVLSPATGREFTSSSLKKQEVIHMRIRNLDDEPATGFRVLYRINKGAWVEETNNVIIPATATYIHAFAVPYDFSKPGNYELQVVVKNNMEDRNNSNDTLTTLIRQLQNEPIDLAKEESEDYERLIDLVYASSFTGLNGADHYDFERISGKGSVSVDKTSALEATGKHLYMKLEDSGDSAIQHVTATYNLSGYDVSRDEVALEFSYTRLNGGAYNEEVVWIRGNDQSPWIKVHSLPTLNVTLRNEKLSGIFIGKILKESGQNFSSSFGIRWSQSGNYWSNLYLDNIRLYAATRDVAVVSIDSLPSFNAGLGNTRIHFTVSNQSKSDIQNLRVRYTVDNGTAVEETIPYIGSGTSIGYIFSVAANLSGIGYHNIKVWVEHPGDSYTGNNEKTLTIFNQQLVNTYPYLENFENGEGAWYKLGSNSSWAYGTPASPQINAAAGGKRAWKTNLSGKYNDNENGALYSPVFDLTGLKKPKLSLSISFFTDYCFFFDCDDTRIQYSTDGVIWRSFPLTDAYNWSNSFASRFYQKWHVITNTFPDTVKKVQIRINFRTDVNYNSEGVAIDDIHIYDGGEIYDSLASSSEVEKLINGSEEWIDFSYEGKKFAAVNAHGQTLGKTTARLNMHPGAANNFHGQYYLNRSFSLQSENKATDDSIGVRLYFLDSEVEALLKDTNCAGCTKPPHAYRLGISSYTTVKPEELNGDMQDNIKGHWTFFDSSKIQIVPFDKGYYVEFKVKELSEFWLNNGGLDRKSFLPTRLSNFSITKSGSNSELQWTTAAEINVERFDIEIAKGNKALEKNEFKKFAEVKSRGRSAAAQSYTSLDAEGGKQGVYYYRLKLVDVYGNYAYSRVIPVVYDHEFQWQVYPNPSPGTFHLSYQVNEGEIIAMEVMNSSGVVLKRQQVTGNGFIQKATINLSNLPSGVYMLKVVYPSGSYSFKLVRI